MIMARVAHTSYANRRRNHFTCTKARANGIDAVWSSETASVDVAQYNFGRCPVHHAVVGFTQNSNGISSVQCRRLKIKNVLATFDNLSSEDGGVVIYGANQGDTYHNLSLFCSYNVMAGIGNDNRTIVGVHSDGLICQKFAVEF